MASTYKVLGQDAPAANTPEDLYIVPAATQAVASTLVVCNRGTTNATVRVAVRPAGASILNQHYIVYDAIVPLHDSLFLTIGLSLSTTDVVTVTASTANISFSLFGSEIT
jgi:hypothetical protein